MKRIFIFFIAACLMCACTPQDTLKDDRISVVCASFPPYDFARSVGGDEINLKLLVPPGSDSHSYDPKPNDIIAVSEADIFIYGGGESDEWVDDILDSLEKEPGRIIAMTDLVKTYREEIKEGMQGEEEGETDEHVWTSPKNAEIISENIADALCAADSAHEKIYRERLTEYKQQLEELDMQFRQAVSQGVCKTLVFGDRFPFRYLVEEYGLDYYAAFPGCAEMTEPSAKTVAFLIDKVKEENIPAVFYTEFSNHKICDTIANETGAKTALLHSCHNLTKQEFESGVNYLELMRRNAAVIKEALGNGAD